MPNPTKYTINEQRHLTLEEWESAGEPCWWIRYETPNHAEFININPKERILGFLPLIMNPTIPWGTTRLSWGVGKANGNNKYLRGSAIIPDTYWKDLMDIAPQTSNKNCETCKTYFVSGGPSHTGSSHCRSGSLASGGSRSHCSCDSCY